jgi:hypothetical protein
MATMRKGSSTSLLGDLNRQKGLGDTTSGLGTVNSKGNKDTMFFVSRVHILTKDKEIRKELLQIEMDLF